jgi:hypothetical protein
VPSPLDAFIPQPDACERFAVPVAAPASVVYEAARNFDLQSVFLVRLIFGLRERLLGATRTSRPRQGFLDDMLALGWGRLLERPGELFVAGATCQPWLADVRFTPLAAGQFRDYAAADQVRIAWTIECHPAGDGRCVLASETRAAATDDGARRRFRRYWRWARFGIIPIRWLLLPAIRRRAEAAYGRRRQTAPQGK